MELRISRFNEAAGIHRRKLMQASNKHCQVSGFNEAAGIHRRKLTTWMKMKSVLWLRFNEAAGIHRRKPTMRYMASSKSRIASMRPPEFTGGNASSGGTTGASGALLQ